MRRSLLYSPVALAVLVTVANAVKPVTVDDTAYLAYAQHIATNPTDPYGFTIIWWSAPEPAMTVLAPPVLPYWLAVGINLFSNSPALLKLWLFPFVWLLAWSLRALLVRFARGLEDFALPLLMLSPAVLPTVNLMLDVPAVALAFAAVEVFIRAAKSQNWWLAILPGLLAGFAMQTKYTAFVAPAVIAWFGLTHRRAGLAAVAVGVAVALFVGWELFLVEKYGQSHFWFHATASAEPPAGQSKLSAFANDKLELIPFLAGYVGCLAVGVGLLAGSVLRVPRRWLVAVAAVWGVGFALVATLPQRWTLLDRDLSATTAFWQVSGALWLVAVAGCAAVLCLRVKRSSCGAGVPPALRDAGQRPAPQETRDAGQRPAPQETRFAVGIRANRATLFLVGWLAIEVAAMLALTPFPAARRVIGVTLAAGLFAARASSRVGRARPERRAPRWVLAVGVVAGVAVAAIDTLDAFPEKACAEMSADFTRDCPETVTKWYVGHWGFQYYCEREGMKPLIAGETVARAGDYIVIPVYPDEGFHRPYAGFAVSEPIWVGDEVAVVEWNDPLSAKTVPNFYGGVDPVAGRDYPRLRVRVWRLRGDWVMK